MALGCSDGNGGVDATSVTELSASKLLQIKCTQDDIGQPFYESDPTKKRTDIYECACLQTYKERGVIALEITAQNAASAQFDPDPPLSTSPEDYDFVYKFYSSTSENEVDDQVAIKLTIYNGYGDHEDQTHYLNIHICKKDKLEVTVPQPFIMGFQIGTNLKVLDRVFVEALLNQYLFIQSGINIAPACKVYRYVFWSTSADCLKHGVTSDYDSSTQTYIPETGGTKVNSEPPLAQYNSQYEEIKLSLIDTVPWKPETYFICAFTKGMSFAAFETSISVCGWETLVLKDSTHLFYLFEAQNAIDEIGDKAQDLFLFTSDAHCPMESYEIMLQNSDGTTYSPYSVLESPYLDGIQLEDKQIKFSLLKPYILSTVYIRAKSFGGQVAYKTLNFEICGHEEIRPIVGPPLEYFHLRSATEVIVEEILVSDLFTVNSTNCIIESYGLAVYDVSTGYAFRSEQDASISDKQMLQINTRTPSMSTFFIKAARQLKAAFYEVHLEVCGTEEVTLNRISYDDFLFNKTQAIKPVYSLQELFMVSRPKCFMTFQLLNETLQNFTEGSMFYDNTSEQVIANLSKGQAPVHLKIKATAQGNLSFAIKNFSMEICGWENVILGPSALSSIVIQVNKNASVMPIEHLNYTSWFVSESAKCPITSVMLVDSPETLAEYTSDMVFVQDLTKELQILTTQAYEKQLYLRGRTQFGTQLVIPLKIKVIALPVIEMINQPPFFEKDPVSITASIDPKKPQLSHSIVIPEILDENNEFELIKFKSTAFGELIWIFYATKPPVRSRKKTSIMKFDPQTSRLTLDFPDYETLLKYEGINSIEITIMDRGKAEKVYGISAVFQIQKEEAAKKKVKVVQVKKEENDAVVKIEFVLKAKIDSVSSTGEMVVRFNSPMKTEGIQLSEFNTSNVDIYVLPHDNWHEDYTDFDMKTLNMTWNATNFTGDALIIKMKFFNPLDISPQFRFDRIVFHVKERGYLFLSKEKLVSLHLNFTTLSSGIPKQMEDNIATKNVLGLAASSKITIEGSLVGTFVANVFAKGIFQSLLSLIKNLQMILHLPIMRIQFSANVVNVFGVLIPIVQFDILADLEVLESFYPDSQADAEKYQLELGQMRQIGYDSFNLILNLGTLGLLIVVYFVKILLYFAILRNISKYHPRIKKFANQVYINLFFSDFLILFNEGLFEFLISSTMKIDCPKTSIDYGGVTLPIAYVNLFIAYICIPCVYLWLLKKDLTVVPKSFTKKWGKLYEDINIKKRVNMLHPLFFVLRRLLFVVIGFYFNGKGSIQIIMLNYLNLSQFIYFGYFMPLKTRSLNRMTFFYETLIQTIMICLFCFTDFVPDKLAQQHMGYLVIGILLISAFVSLLGMALMIGNSLRLYLILLWNHIKIWRDKQKKDLEKQREETRLANQTIEADIEARVLNLREQRKRLADIEDRRRGIQIEEAKANTVLEVKDQALKEEKEEKKEKRRRSTSNQQLKQPETNLNKLAKSQKRSNSRNHKNVTDQPTKLKTDDKTGIVSFRASNRQLPGVYPVVTMPKNTLDAQRKSKRNASTSQKAENPNGGQIQVSRWQSKNLMAPQEFLNVLQAQSSTILKPESQKVSKIKRTPRFEEAKQSRKEPKYMAGAEEYYKKNNFNNLLELTQNVRKQKEKERSQDKQRSQEKHNLKTKDKKQRKSRYGSKLRDGSKSREREKRSKERQDPPDNSLIRGLQELMEPEKTYEKYQQHFLGGARRVEF